jgi:putative tricarboxylic transport membrane protein
MAETRRSELVAAGALLSFSIVFTLSSLRLKTGKISNPGPGLMPLLLGLALTACALVYLIHQLRTGHDQSETLSSESPGGRSAHRVPLCIVAAVVAYPFLLAWLEFLCATTLVVFGVMWLLRFKTPGWSLAVSIVMTFLCYLLFARVLGVVLPAGSLEELLFKWI